MKLLEYPELPDAQSETPGETRDVSRIQKIEADNQASLSELVMQQILDEEKPEPTKSQDKLKLEEEPT